MSLRGLRLPFGQAMHWKLKAAIQSACGAVPWAAEAVYYGLQSAFGTLRRSPEPFFKEAVSLSQWLEAAGTSIRGARVLEVGTGRRVDLPIGLALAGAACCHTFDLHRYLKPVLVEQSLDYLRNQRATVESIFLPAIEQAVIQQAVIQKDSFYRRLDALAQAGSCAQALPIAGIVYHAPADAASTGLPAASIDVHTSYTVFEHIPRDALRSILLEGKRVLAPGGVALHHIDPSDHFSHEDSSLASINFLRFSEREWDRRAGNQFAYHNRLRSSHYRALFEECGYEIVRWQEWLDSRAVELLRNGFPLDPQFQGLAAEDVCCAVVRVLARPRC